MKEIPFIKRILSYLLLSLISLMIMVMCSGIFREYEMTHFYRGVFVLAFLIPYYIFGAIFLKTKLNFKLIVPFIATIVSFSCTLLIHTSDIFEYLFPVTLLFPIVVWEIAYQILIRINNSTK